MSKMSNGVGDTPETLRPTRAPAVQITQHPTDKIQCSERQKPGDWGRQDRIQRRVQGSATIIACTLNFVRYVAEDEIACLIDFYLLLPLQTRDSGRQKPGDWVRQVLSH